jgi:hypothetical protein
MHFSARQGLTANRAAPLDGREAVSPIPLVSSALSNSWGPENGVGFLADAFLSAYANHERASHNTSGRVGLPGRNTLLPRLDCSYFRACF